MSIILIILIIFEWTWDSILQELFSLRIKVVVE